MKVIVEGQTCIVKWEHRHQERVQYSSFLSKNVNGETLCSFESPKMDLQGRAFCLLEDQYEKNVGRKKSMTRALAVLNRPIRKLFWKAYQEEIGV